MYFVRHFFLFILNMTFLLGSELEMYTKIDENNIRLTCYVRDEKTDLN